MLTCWCVVCDRTRRQRSDCTEKLMTSTIWDQWLNTTWMSTTTSPRSPWTLSCSGQFIVYSLWPDLERSPSHHNPISKGHHDLTSKGHRVIITQSRKVTMTWPRKVTESPWPDLQRSPWPDLERSPSYRDLTAKSLTFILTPQKKHYIGDVTVDPCRSQLYIIWTFDLERFSSCTVSLFF